MPVIASVSVGKVTAIWGNALVRLPDGSTRVLKLGDIVRKGEVILTRQDSIVEIRNDDGQVWNTAEGQLIPETDAPVRQATTPVPAEIDRVIQALNQDDPEAATAAGAPQGGGEAAPALRVDRIAEASGSPLTGIEVPRIATPTSDIVDLSGPGTLQTGNLPPVVTPPGGTVVTAGSSAIQAQEEGASIGLALPAPASSGSGAITVTVTALPTIGEIRTAAGTVVAVGDVLSTSLLQGLVYVPPADYVAGSPVGDFVYTATDGSSVAQGRTTIGMTAVNDQPVAIGEGSMAAPVMTVAQGSGPSSPITVLTNDTDADGDPLTVVSASSPNGSVTINPDDTLVFTPTPGYSGPATITYTISDGQGGSSTASVHLAVSANNAPIAVDDGSAATPLVSVAEDSGASAPITVLGNDSDPDGHPLGVIAATSPNGTVTINANGTLSFTPAANFNGPTTISYTISDGQGGTATATVHVAVTPVNDAPVATDDGTAASPLLTVPEDSGASAPITVLANDTDVDGDPLAVVAATSPNGTVTINPDGSLSFTPAANFSGPTTISYTVSDGQGGTSTATVHVAVTPVNDAPVATDDGSVASPLLTVAEDSGASAPITVLANDTDVDGDPLTVVAATSPNGAVTINADGTLSFTPAANFSGPTTISYTISDGQGGTSTATVHVAVTPDNDGPTAVDDGTPAAPALTVAEDSGASAPITVLANDTDDDGDPLSIIAATSPNGTVTINPDGTLSFTPAANFNGPTTISYTISDGEGGSSTAVVHVAVTPVNDAPVAQPAAAVVAEDAPVLTGNVVATDVDAGAVLSFALTGGAPAGLAFNPDGSFAFDPSNAAYQSLGVGQSVVLTMPYTVTDDQGATSTANLVITVTGTNDAPVAQAASFSVAEDGAPISGTVVATDVDANAVLGFALTGAAPAGLSFNADGSYSFDPSNAAYQSLGAGQSVLITVPYRVTDDQGASSIANLVITVTGSNDAPVAQAASFSVAEDAPVVNGSVAATDSDGNATLSYALVGAAPAGLVFNADGSYAFDASAAPYQSLGVGQSTVLTVSYRVTDDQGATSTANLVITVTGTNDAPVAQAASVLTSEGAAVLTGAVVGTDIDANAALSYALVGSAPAGLVFGSDGSYSFDPSNAAYQSLGTGQSQVITVPYRVTDDQGATSTANLVITITGSNDAPVAQAASFSVAEDAAVVSGAVVATDADANAVLGFALNGAAPAGLTFNADGSYSFNPANAAYQSLGTGQSQVITVPYTVTDDQGATSTANLVITVTGTNDAPVAQAASFAVAEDAPTISGAVSASDIDANATLSFGLVGAAPAGLTFNADGSYSFDPSNAAYQSLGAGQSTVITVPYRVTDDQGASSIANLVITVTGSNDAPVAQAASFSVAEDAAVVTGAVVATDTDAGATLSYALVGAAPAGLVFASSGSYSFDPSNAAYQSLGVGQSVVLTVPYTVTDDQGATSTANLVITITGTNDAPVAQAASFSVAEDATIVSGTVVATGVDANAVLGFALNGAAPAGLTFNGDGSYSFDATNATYQSLGVGQSVVLTVPYTVTDDQGATSTANLVITITGSNDAPVAQAAARTVAEDAAPIGGSVVATDTDANAALSYALNGAAPAGLVFAASGSYSFDPSNAAYQSLGVGQSVVLTVPYTVTDDQGATSTANLVITVTGTNDAPVAGAASVTVAEDGAPISGAVAASDVDANAVLGFALNGAAPAGLVFNADGSYSFNPANAAYQSLGVGQSVVLTVPYTVTDDQGATSTANLVITVTGSNDAPVAQAASFSVAEDATVVNGAVVATDTDANAALSYALNGAAPAGLVFASSGSYSFDPSNAAYQSLGVGQSVVLTVPYTVTDDQGATSTANLVITVTGSNDAPLAQAAARTVAEDAAPISGSVVATDVDANATLGYALVGAAPAGLTFNADGSYSFDPSNAAYQSLGVGQSQVITVPYRVTDDQGATSTANLVITVTGSNDAPLASAASFSVAEDAATISGAVSASDVDANATLSFALNGAAPAGLSFNADGSYSFNPANAAYQSLGVGQSAVLTVPYTVTDDQGATSTANLVITITGTNDAPVAGAASFTVAEGALPVTGSVTATDIDANTVLSYSLNGAAPAGLVFNSDGSYSFDASNAAYEPLAVGQSVVLTVPYTVTDDQGATSTANLVITVTGTNGGPVAQPESFSVAEDAAIVNGNVVASDPDGTGGLSYALVGVAPAGLVFNADGSYSFNPANAAYQSLGVGQSQVLSLSYTVTDDQGESSTASFVITVTGTNDGPVAAAASFSVAEDAAIVSGNVVATDIDANAVLGYSLNGAAPAGLSFNADGSYSFNAANAAYQSLGAGQSVVLTVPYTVTDDQGATSTANLVITVTGANDAPVAVASSFSVAEDAAVVSGSVTATDADGNASLGYALNGAAPAGLVFNADGSYSFDPANAAYQSLGVGQSAVLTVPYTVTDDQGATSTANLVITITGTNDAPVAQAAAFSVAEDAPVVTGSVLATDVDANATLTFALVGAAPAGLVFNADGSYSFDASNPAYQSLAAGQSQVVTVPYRVTDDQGATSTANLVITVTGTNDGPVAQPAAFTVAEDAAVVSGNVVAVDPDAGPAPSYGLVGGAPAGLTFNADGSYSFNPGNAAYQSLAAGQSQVITVPYRVTDDQGATSTANLVITITGSNDAPVAGAASFTVAEDAATISGAVSATDADTGAVLSFALNGAAPAGLVFNADGSYSFNPANAAYQSLGVGQSAVLTV
ncbi:Ig-like domain-containing protein, partial [uncultured Methylibium sp.]|uniref:Ig-like domain-containing protein n=1 Tax=uncultured Methylibium sp. TaxID=381093 RepID=UPI0025DBC420